MSEFSVRKTGWLYGFFIFAPQEHLGFELDSVDGYMASPLKSVGIGLAAPFHKIDGPIRNCFGSCLLYQADQSGSVNLSFSWKSKELSR